MIGFLYIILVFAVCFLLAVVSKIGYSYLKDKRKPNEPTPPPDPKVYYITEKIKKPQKKRRRKKPNIALSGVIIQPERFTNDSK